MFLFSSVKSGKNLKDLKIYVMSVAQDKDFSLIVLLYFEFILIKIPSI